jgi:hypothetical protein
MREWSLRKIKEKVDSGLMAIESRKRGPSRREERRIDGIETLRVEE